MSSRTSWAVSTVSFCPSLMTTPLGEASILSLSSVFLERVSCTMPMTVLQMTTPIKVRLSHFWTSITATARMQKIRLKYVNTLSLTICFMVLPGGSTGVFSHPASVLSLTCCALRP